MQQREKVEVQEVGQRATPNVILQHGGSEHKKMKWRGSRERGLKGKGKAPKAEVPKENWHSHCGWVGDKWGLLSVEHRILKVSGSLVFANGCLSWE